MSSDTFYIRVQSIEGTSVVLRCTTSTAGGLNDYACTRSFALMAIADCMPSLYSANLTPLVARLKELGGGGYPPVWETSFHQEHIGEFIKSTELLAREGIITDEAAWSRGRFDESDPDAERKYPLHAFLLRVEMADPRWLEGLAVGDSGGTTAFDAWWDDPTRPSRAQLAAVERKATRWRPPAKAAKPKATATEAPTAKKTSKKKATTKTATKAASTKTTKKPATKTTTKTAKKTSKKAASKKTSKKTSAKKTAS